VLASSVFGRNQDEKKEVARWSKRKIKKKAVRK
jgi:hypothetical protein